jgi:hypothetical protein
MGKRKILTKKNKKHTKIKSKKIKKNSKYSMKGGVDPLNMIKYQTFHALFKENEPKILIPPEEINIHGVNKHTIENIKTKIQHNYNTEIKSISQHNNQNQNQNQNQNKIPSKIEIKSIERDTILFFLEYLKNNIRYINFTEYLQKIELICDNIRTQIINSDDYDTIILIASMQIEKSNFWILLLYLKFIDTDLMAKIETKQIYVTSNIEQLYTYYQNPEVILTKKVAVIYFDDMIYTGLQAASAFKYKRLNNDMVDIFLGVGFITTTTIKLFTRFFQEKIKIFDNIEIIPSMDVQLATWVTEQYNNLMEGKESIFNKLFKELFTDENKAEHKIIYDLFKNLIFIKLFKFNEKLPELSELPTINSQQSKHILHSIYLIKKLYKPFESANKKTLVYFDHKLADGVSTMDVFLRFGTYPINENQECQFESVINNCEPYETPKNLCQEALEGITDEKSCPKTFYKTIKYTFNGRELHKTQNIDTLFALITLLKNEQQ